MTSASAPDTLTARYSPDDLRLFDDSERAMFLAPFGDLAEAAIDGDEEAWSRIAPEIAWELMYRKEPELWERLVRGEHVHPAVIDRLPSVGAAVEVAAGGGRLTFDVAARCERLIAVEPSSAFRELLSRKLVQRGVTNVDVRRGFFDRLPLEDATAELVASCSSFTADPAHGGDAGLEEMTRVAVPGGMIALVWPSDVDWLRSRGFTYESFEGEMAIDFGSLEDAVELARIAYPWAVDAIRERGSGRVPYEIIGMNPPRDLAWKRIG